MRYRRRPIEIESPEETGYGTIACNLAESSVADASLDDLRVDLRGLLLRYGDHRGLPELRELIAADAGRPLPSDATPLDPADVLVTAGAAGALFVVATALLEPGDELVVVRPNYATNLETPRAIGAEIRILDLRPEDDWATDPDALAALVTPRTRLVSMTNPHNPTGALLPEDALRRIVGIVEAHPAARLLVDETYREMTYGGPLPPAATLSPRVIGVSGMSKTYGLPGIRTGWLATRDAELMTTFLAAKEQIQITGSLVDEAIAARALERRAELLPPILTGIATALGTVRAWLAGEPRLAWVEPRGGVVGFPWIRAEAGIDPDAFHRALVERHATAVGPGHWFERPRSFFRLGFGWPPPAELAEGLARISRALDDATDG
ncbi:MAG TPA: aminotransferase class I/II-fold pyridoxal phosphate-dependent enzyme [Candidatus Nanopelagicales bacterium]|nr:aminotransferase class I/II-fold pyridoxal phosphate-dependent enzyme [Candidatus Nanopelagicales bacterium]